MARDINRRILIIDDNATIHEDFRKILGTPQTSDAEADALIADFFGEASPTHTVMGFEVHSAYQGEEGLEQVARAEKAEAPFAVVFVDMRMPPGWDGLETIQRIWAEYPKVQIVICTAFSDYSWEELQRRLGETDKLLILKKPFDGIEARQLAIALTHKWELARQAQLKMDELHKMVEARTKELMAARDELAQTNRELEKAVEVAHLANRSKSEFLANMSHEIRTPITAILGFAEELREDTGPISPDHRQDAVETVIRNGHHLLKVINDILDISKIEAGKLEIQTTSSCIREILFDVVALMEGRAAEKGLRLESALADSIPETVYTDPQRLRQILINLIGNAMKFTAHGTVKVSVERLHSDCRDAQLLFTVSDTGCGIPQDHLDRIFNAFEQADATVTREFGGTGLGLSISRRLAELLGGTLDVDSRVGEGSTFRFTITSARPSDATITLHRETDHSEDHRMRRPVSLEDSSILLCEDGIDNQRLIKFILERAGADVTVCENGQLGIEMAAQASAAGQSFDLVLMDMSMPVMDGYTAARLLRDQGFSNPIIALTAYAMTGDREKCLQAGCDDFVSKPIDRQALLRTLDNYVPA